MLLGNRLSDLEMTAFAEFVNSIHYGPNARQPRNRKYSGDFGDPDIFVFDPTISDGSRGALRGLKIFHTVATLQQSPCVRCHSLPEGSNNLITVNNAPTESAALRGLVQKEAKRDEDGFSDPAETAYTGFYGMFHAGFLGPLPPDHPLHLHLINPVATVNSFINLVFQATLCPGQEPFCPDGQMTAQFVHELDTGIGPMVGRALTVRNDDLVEAFVPTTTGCDPRDSSLDGLLDCMEEQARQANSGVVVQGQVAGLRRGFWYSATDRLYSEEPSATLFTRRHLLDLVNLPQDHLTFTASPLGSERRLAAQSSASQIIAPGPRPSSLELLPMVPSIANREIPSQDRAWADLDNEKQKSRFVHRLRVYQHVLVEKGRELRRAGQPDYGLDRVRHDAPRRFRVAGRGIRHGAKMQLFTYERLAETMPTAIGTLPLTEASVASLPTRTTELPIFATSHRTPEGLTIWETAVELEPLVYYRLMLGWMSAPGVSEVFHDLDQCPSTKANEPPCFRFSDPPTPEEIDLFEPDVWNWHFVRVLNSDGTSGDGGWQRLRIE